MALLAQDVNADGQSRCSQLCSQVSHSDAKFAAQLHAIDAPPYTNMLDYPVAISANPDWRNFRQDVPRLAVPVYVVEGPP